MAIALFGLLAWLPASSQTSNISFAGGWGPPELAHLEFGVRSNQWRYSVHGGVILGGDIYSMGLGVQYHVLGNSDLTDIRPWYFRGGLTYTHEEQANAAVDDIWLTLRTGRQFNFNSRMGISGELGVMRNVYNQTDETDDGESPNEFRFSPMPVFRVNLFVRL